MALNLSEWGEVVAQEYIDKVALRAGLNRIQPLNWGQVTQDGDRVTVTANAAVNAKDGLDAFFERLETCLKAAVDHAIVIRRFIDERDQFSSAPVQVAKFEVTFGRLDAEKLAQAGKSQNYADRGKFDVPNTGGRGRA